MKNILTTPKLLEMLNSGARKAIFDKQFQELAINEIQSSMSKSKMINRVRRFLPKIDVEKITEKGTAGIRSSVINENGQFVPDVLLEENSTSFHILKMWTTSQLEKTPFFARGEKRICNEI